MRVAPTIGLIAAMSTTTGCAKLESELTQPELSQRSIANLLDKDASAVERLPDLPKMDEGLSSYISFVTGAIQENQENGGELESLNIARCEDQSHAKHGRVDVCHWVVVEDGKLSIIHAQPAQVQGPSSSVDFTLNNGYLEVTTSNLSKPGGADIRSDLIFAWEGSSSSVDSKVVFCREGKDDPALTLSQNRADDTLVVTQKSNADRCLNDVQGAVADEISGSYQHFSDYINDRPSK